MKKLRKDQERGYTDRDFFSAAVVTASIALAFALIVGGLLIK